MATTTPHTTTSPNRPPDDGGPPCDGREASRPSEMDHPSDPSNRPGVRSSGFRPLFANRRLLALLAVLALLAPLVVAAAQQNNLEAPSPASGHASVIAQGIVDFPEGEFVCRVVERVAQPLGAALFEEQELGFVIATEGALLLADEIDGEPEQVARLAVGELYLVQDGTVQRRASASDQPVTYTVLEIVSASRVGEVGDGRLLLASDAISAPTGSRDLDLVQDVLAFNERSSVTNPGAGMAILATDGAVEVVPRGGRPRTLQEGEIGIFPEGVEVRSVEGTGGNAKSSVVSALSHAFGKQTAAGGSSFLACVIGPEVPPLTESPGIVPRTVPGPGNAPPPSDNEVPSGGEAVDAEPTVPDTDPETVDPTPTVTPSPTLEPTPTQPTGGDDLSAEPTPTTRGSTVFQTPIVRAILLPTSTPEAPVVR